MEALGLRGGGTTTSVRMIEQHYGKLLQDDARERLNRIAFA